MFIPGMQGFAIAAKRKIDFRKDPIYPA